MATIDDLPDDVLIDIFKLLMPLQNDSAVSIWWGPISPHGVLRSVCRRWTPLADWARLDGGRIFLTVYEVPDANASALRASQPTAFKKLLIAGLHGDIYRWRDPKPVEHTLKLPHALESLTRDPDLRRSLRQLNVCSACCVAALAPAAIATLTALTKLNLEWTGHTGQPRIENTWLAPLSQLVRLERLTLSFCGDIMPPPNERWPMTTWPTLPDAPRLTSLKLFAGSHFIPNGSDASIARLRRLKLACTKWAQHVEPTDDYFGLRAALDGGAWHPHRFTGLQELHVSFLSNYFMFATATAPPIARSAPGAEWLPLAAQITKLVVKAEQRHSSSPLPPTGIIAGLGVLTALRELHVVLPVDHDFKEEHTLPVDWPRVTAPRLTRLVTEHADVPFDASPFPKLEEVRVHPAIDDPVHSGIVLSSLAGRSRLRVIDVALYHAIFNLAELFVGGVGLPALEELFICEGRPVWDVSEAAGAPSADEFANNVRELLPSLKRVNVDEVNSYFWRQVESDFDDDGDDVEYDSENDEDAARQAREARYEAWQAARPLTKFRTIVRPALKRLCAERHG